MKCQIVLSLAVCFLEFGLAHSPEQTQDTRCLEFGTRQYSCIDTFPYLSTLLPLLPSPLALGRGTAPRNMPTISAPLDRLAFPLTALLSAIVSIPATVASPCSISQGREVNTATIPRPTRASLPILPCCSAQAIVQLQNLLQTMDIAVHVAAPARSADGPGAIVRFSSRPRHRRLGQECARMHRSSGSQKHLPSRSSQTTTLRMPSLRSDNNKGGAR